MSPLDAVFRIPLLLPKKHEAVELQNFLRENFSVLLSGNPTLASGLYKLACLFDYVSYRLAPEIPLAATIEVDRSSQSQKCVVGGDIEALETASELSQRSD